KSSRLWACPAPVSIHLLNGNPASPRPKRTAPSVIELCKVRSTTRMPGSWAESPDMQACSRPRLTLPASPNVCCAVDHPSCSQPRSSYSLAVMLRLTALLALWDGTRHQAHP